MKYAATLLVDASWCPQTGAAGFGYWIASDRGKFGGGDSLDCGLSSSNAAEMWAIVSVMAIALRRNYIQTGEIALIQSDCQAAIVGLQGNRPLNSEEQEAYGIFRTFCEDATFHIRHVKGHTSSSEPRHYANRMCDQRARVAMKKARAKILEEINGREASSSASA